MANELLQIISHQWLQSGFFDDSSACIVGHWAGDPTDGALRFPSVTIPPGANVSLARLVYKYGSVGGSGTWKHELNGIKEVNTGAFGYPFGRPLTTAQINVNEGPPTSGGTKTYDVASIVNEIVAQVGWTSGNAVGFIFRDTGSDTNVYAQCDLSNSYLVYRVAAAPNFKPTPKSVAAPSLPAADDWGIKISRPGVSVLDATENQLYFTTRKKQFKIYLENSYVSTGSSLVTIPHNLGYQPLCEVRYKIPAGSAWLESPDVNGGNSGVFHRADNTNLYISAPDAGYSIYYYISYDRLV